MFASVPHGFLQVHQVLQNLLLVLEDANDPIVEVVVGLILGEDLAFDNYQLCLL